MTVTELLMRSKDCVSVPGCWTQGASARTSEGVVVPGSSTFATCWCAGGVLDSFPHVSENTRLLAWEYLRQAAHRLFRMLVVFVNDLKGLPSVCAMYDHAIYAASEAGA